MKKAITATYFKTRQAAKNFIIQRKRKEHIGKDVNFVILESGEKGFIVVSEKRL